MSNHWRANSAYFVFVRNIDTDWTSFRQPPSLVNRNANFLIKMMQMHIERRSSRQNDAQFSSQSMTQFGENKSISRSTKTALIERSLFLVCEIESPFSH